ncbi:MAG: signal peptide peptidase SppA [Candidatus Babeliales bacterium]
MAKFTDYLKALFFLLVLLQIAPPIIKSFMKNYTNMLEPQTKIAYLPLKGVLYDSTDYVHYLRKYFKDNEIKAILLRVECPGSAAATGEIIAHEIELLKKEYPKPIITLCENICTSGAYYIASSTDYIIAAPSTFVGSIGSTIPYQFRFDKLLKYHNIEYKDLSSGDYKNSTDPFIETTPEQLAMLQDLSDDSYQNFIEHVAKQRHKLSKEKASEWANGKIFTGNQAFKLGLIDEIGSQSDAVRKIKEMAIVVGEIEWVKPEPKSSLLSLFGGDRENSTELQSSLLQATLDNVCSYLETRYAYAH